MFSPTRRLASSLPLRVCRQCMSARPTYPILRSQRHVPWRVCATRERRATFATITSRSFSTSQSADEVVEHLTELYENAREEFQIATEETEENTIYAADDRAAAQAELGKLKEFYGNIVENSTQPLDLREEVKRRTGHRIRELDSAMKALEEKAMSQD